MTNAVPKPEAGSLPELVRRAALTYADQRALSCVLPNGWMASLTYAELDQMSDHMAAWFSRIAGVKRGDVVAIQAPNILSYPVVLLGALKAGAAVSGINPLYTPRETERQLEDCGAKVFVGFDVFGEMVDTVAASFPETPVLMLSASDGFSPFRRTVIDVLAKRVKRVVPPIRTLHTTFRDAVAQGRSLTPPDIDQALSGADPCFLAYSGGTTGVPKGVALTSEGLLTNVAQVQALSPEVLKKSGRNALLILPLYHMYGGFMLVTTLTTGGHLALAPSPRPLSNLKAGFEKVRPDVFPGVNTLFAGLL
ncbi:MAG: AMP-binding protein, partial [Pseudomonadota bacterium]